MLGGKLSRVNRLSSTLKRKWQRHDVAPRISTVNMIGAVGYVYGTMLDSVRTTSDPPGNFSQLFNGCHVAKKAASSR